MTSKDVAQSSYPRVIWTIAGSDCSGGAGIQADLKTAHQLGEEMCTIITAVTAQNGEGVQAINPVSDDVIVSQIQSLASTCHPRVIKIGLLANAAQVKLVGSQLAAMKQTWAVPPLVVYDPVAIASNGSALTESDIAGVMKQHLLPWVDVLTPNGDELLALTASSIQQWSDRPMAAITLLALGVGAVVVKGGHLDAEASDIVDYCTDGEHQYWLSNTRLETTSTHGTGCTFAAAMAVFLAQGYHLRDAFTLSNAYVHQGLTSSGLHSARSGMYEAVYQGSFPKQLADFPRPLVAETPHAHQLSWPSDETTEQSQPSFASGFAPCDVSDLGVYPVVDSVAWCERLLRLGVKTIQYREKNLTGEALEQAICQAIQLGRQYQAQLFINDYWQLALKHDAYGVHLGQEDLVDANLKAIQEAGLRLGVSTHGHYEFLRAMQYQPSYLAVGAIFPTQTKDMTGQIQGVTTLADLIALNTKIPTVAIGGITVDNAPQVIRTGVDAIAVVSAITQAADPEQAVRQFQGMFQRGD